MAIGAILALAVNVPTTGIDLAMVGWILVFVGLGVMLYSLLWWNDAMPWRRGRTVIHERYVEPRIVDEPDPVYRHEHHVVEERERRIS